MAQIFYVRCSTEEQNEARQIEMAHNFGADKIYIEKSSGKNRNREQLNAMLDFVREGDTVVCESISRISRNTRDLLNIVDELHRKNVEFVSLKEKIDTSTPQGKFVLTLFGALSELERESILQRQSEGIAIAKKNGIYKGRKPKQVDEDKFRALCNEWRQGKRTATSIQKIMGITAPTFYQWVRARNL